MAKAVDVNENTEQRDERERDKAKEKANPVQGKALRVNENSEPEQQPGDGKPANPTS